MSVPQAATTAGGGFGTGRAGTDKPVALRWLESFVVPEELHAARAAGRLRPAPSALGAQVRAVIRRLRQEAGTTVRAG